MHHTPELDKREVGCFREFAEPNLPHKVKMQNPVYNFNNFDALSSHVFSPQATLRNSCKTNDFMEEKVKIEIGK